MCISFYGLFLHAYYLTVFNSRNLTYGILWQPKRASGGILTVSGLARVMILESYPTPVCDAIWRFKPDTTMFYRSESVFPLSPPNSSAVLDYYCYFFSWKTPRAYPSCLRMLNSVFKTVASYSQVHLLCQMHPSVPAICI